MLQDPWSVAVGGPRYYIRTVYPFLKRVVSSFTVSEDEVHIGMFFFGKPNLETFLQESNGVSINMEYFDN